MYYMSSVSPAQFPHLIPFLKLSLPLSLFVLVYNFIFTLILPNQICFM